MKWTIVCFKEGKMIGYWWDNKEGQYGTMGIKRDVAQLYDDEKKLRAAFDIASANIPTYHGEDTIPAIAVIVTENTLASFKLSLDRHLMNAELSWGLNMPERITKIKKAIKRILTKNKE